MDSHLHKPVLYVLIIVYNKESSPIICGFVSSVMYSILIRKFHLNHKKIVLFNLIPVLVSLGLSYFALMTESLPLVLLCYSVLQLYFIGSWLFCDSMYTITT